MNGFTLISGTFKDSTALATHVVAYSFVTISFMFPLSFGTAASIRVGTLLGEGRPHAAKKSAKISVFVTVVWMLINISVFLLSASKAGYLFTSDEQVVQDVAKLMPIAALTCVKSSKSF